MKRILSFIAAVITAVVFSLMPVSAKGNQYKDEEYGFSITLSDDYTLINRTNLSKNEEFIKRLGYSVKTFRMRMEESGIVLYAADKDNQHQVQVKMWQSDLSQEVKNLTGATDEQLSELLYLMSEQLSLDDGRLVDSRITTKNNQKFLTYTVEVTDAFCYVQNITVVGGKCYSLVYYNSSPSFTQAEKDEQLKLLDSFTVKRVTEKGNEGGYYLIIRIICAIVAIAAIVVAVCLLSSFIRDIRRRKEQPEVIPDKIKMRRK